MKKKGSEADIIIEGNTAKKIRRVKRYMDEQLARSLAVERTKREYKIMKRAKEMGIPCPNPVRMENGNVIVMERINGREWRGKGAEVGKILAMLHSAEIFHGDFTTSNIMESERGAIIIDFGLSGVSKRIEDYAVDVITMVASLESEKQIEEFIRSYKKEFEKGKTVIKRCAKVISRTRYSGSKLARFFVITE